MLNDFKSEAQLGYKYTSLMHLQNAPAPKPLTVTMLSNQISAVDDVASPMKRTATSTLLLRGVKLGELSKESSFGVFVDVGNGTGSVSDANFVGRFSTVEPVQGEPPGGLTIALSTTALKPLLGGKPKLVVRALDDTGRSKGAGIPLSATSVSLL